LYAAAVAQKTDIRFSDLRDYWSTLSAIHVAPDWLWQALVARVVSNETRLELLSAIYTLN